MEPFLSRCQVAVATLVRVGSPSCPGPVTILQALPWTGLVSEIAIYLLTYQQVLFWSCPVMFCIVSILFSSMIQNLQDFDDPNYLWFSDKAAQWDAEKIDMEEENLRLQLIVARQSLLIDDLEEQVREEKMMAQQLRNDKIQHEIYLAFQDLVIEELEANVEGNNKKDVAQQDKIKDLEVFTEMLIRFLVVTFSVLSTLAAVLIHIYVKF